MGLTVHYSLKKNGISATRTRALVEQLHQAALNLPFQRVGEIIDKSRPEECDFNNYPDDETRWLIVQATESVDYDRRKNVCLRSACGASKILKIPRNPFSRRFNRPMG